VLSGNHGLSVRCLGLSPVPVAPNNANPITNAGAGSNHQIVIPQLPNYTHLAGGLPSVSYSETISAQDGTSPYTFTVTSGSLPTGTTINSSSGVISGTPSATGTFGFTITVTDSLGYTGDQAFQIIIAAAVSGSSAPYLG
jgi:hypothetical protein